MKLSTQQEQMCNESRWDFSDLTALFLNCTLKKSPDLSHTQGLIDISIAIMEKNGMTTECLRPVDRDIASGVWPNMTEHGCISLKNSGRIRVCSWLSSRFFGDDPDPFRTSAWTIGFGLCF